VTRRPLGLRLVTLWLALFFLVTLGSTVRGLTGYRGPVTTAPGYFALVELCYMGVLVYGLVGLFQLRTVPILLCLLLLASWLLPVTFRLASRFPTDPPRLRVLVLFAILLVPNGLAMWYLARPTFWVFRKRFRIEKNAEYQRQLLEKRIRTSAH